jgi:hypothetical protein
MNSFLGSASLFFLTLNRGFSVNGICSIANHLDMITVSLVM